MNLLKGSYFLLALRAKCARDGTTLGLGISHAQDTEPTILYRQFAKLLNEFVQESYFL